MCKQERLCNSALSAGKQLKRLAPSRMLGKERAESETYEELAPRLDEVGGSLPIHSHGGITLTRCNFHKGCKVVCPISPKYAYMVCTMGG